MKYRALVVLALLASCKLNTSSTMGGGGGAPTGGGGGETGGGDGWVVAPDLEGKSLDEAKAAAKAAGFKSEVEDGNVACQDEKQLEGKVVCQSVDPGKRVRDYTMIQVHIYKKHVFTGMLVRDQLKPLKGMSLTQARTYLKSLGHTGQLKTETLQQHVASCEKDIVCGVASEAGVGIGDDVTVYVNLFYDGGE
jgi:beta-lactam-binding protein with PASTA domain